MAVGSIAERDAEYLRVFGEPRERLRVEHDADDGRLPVAERDDDELQILARLAVVNVGLSFGRASAHERSPAVAERALQVFAERAPFAHLDALEDRELETLDARGPHELG